MTVVLGLAIEPLAQATQQVTALPSAVARGGGRGGERDASRGAYREVPVQLHVGVHRRGRSREVPSLVLASYNVL
ncbi:hypothetical protein B0H21DRAFT_741461 [Amylocystis lapponica]|nr:hypothetical protein B0H21DRAFT_741461 [Amylocystis lapponica]